MESNAELCFGVVIFAIIRVYFEIALMIHHRPLKVWLARGNRVVLPGADNLGMLSMPNIA